MMSFQSGLSAWPGLQPALVCALVLLAGAVTASAQTPRATGPFAGLFGGAKAENSQSLDFRASGFGIWQDVVVPADVDRSTLDPAFQESGTLGGASASLDYSFNRRVGGSAFYGSLQGMVADYSVTPKQPSYTASGMTGVSTNLTRRIHFTAFGGATYSPYFSLYLLGSQDVSGPGPPALGLNAPSMFGAPNDQLSQTLAYATAVARVDNIVAITAVTISTKLSRRSSLYAGLDYNEFFSLRDGYPHQRRLNGRAGYAHVLGRGVGFHAGYQRSQNLLVGTDIESTPTEGIDAGLDYASSFRLSRRTTFSFGSSVVGAGTPTDSAIHYALLGNASLSHGMGRTWSSALSFNRTFSFIPGSSQPILADSLTATLNGLISRRVSWSSNGSVVRGRIGFSGAYFNSYSVTSGAGYALGRRGSVFAQYNYYSTDLPEDVSSILIPGAFARQSAVVGLSFYAPIYGGRRSAR